jgi:hypothetical protein
MEGDLLKDSYGRRQGSAASLRRTFFFREKAPPLCIMQKAERKKKRRKEKALAVGTGTSAPKQKEVAMDERETLRKELIKTIVRMGYPASLGEAIADNLRTEKPMRRMIGYLDQAGPRSAEEIADEMLAIMEDRQRWIRKKEAEYYNSRYNELLCYGLGEEED